ncbi:substrate-binding and VWA domain-containing protein [Actinokineospora bangkokensis]|uniref:VWFA domain-containing protein n=1 Tax=Actinokineospora bangkokensis TaxID=1193682 RepID=A0A1Q9LD02_9PSEU|nr:substrate-binding and VWA domain-containing protein [Actinokineospora bangkokensis]OLR89911.1 hypothetical protein BJP25_02610 [Actinokineospora bangkokensis]
MGRHSSGRGGARPAVLAVVGAVVVGLLAWLGVAVVPGWFGPTCDRTTELAVTAAPDIAPLVDELGKRAAADPQACYRVVVTAQDSVAVAESLAVSASGTLPDVWIPESTLSLDRARANGGFTGRVNGTSLASSPVVLATTDDVAGALGWPQRTPTWADLLAVPAGTALGVPDPARDPVGTSALFGVRAVAERAPDPSAALTSTLRRVAAGTAPRAADLFDRLPGGSADQPLGVIAATEHDVLRHNAREGSTKLVAGYADPPVPSMDYPYTVLPSTPQDRRDVALAFAGRLLDESSVRFLGDAGYRAADGSVLRDRSQDQRTSSARVARTTTPDDDAVAALLEQWAGANRSSRTQVLLDVSGSMAQAVPGTGKDRMAITTEAASLGMTLFQPTSEYGMWLFSTNLDGDKDYRELLPMGPVRDHLAAGAAESVKGVKAVAGGATGLYDSVLAAYRLSRENWEAGRINVVIVMTDGRNEDANGISREGLLAELAELQDPRRPLPLVGVGIGPDVDEAELRSIAEATGGKAYTTPDPTKIADIFYAALAAVMCPPAGCTP